MLEQVHTHIYITQQHINEQGLCRTTNPIALAIKAHALQLRKRGVQVQCYADCLRVTHKRKTVEFAFAQSMQRWSDHWHATAGCKFNNKRVILTLNPYTKTLDARALVTRRRGRKRA